MVLQRTPPAPPLLPPPGISVDVVACPWVHPQLRLDWGDANRDVQTARAAVRAGMMLPPVKTSESTCAMPIAAAMMRTPRLVYVHLLARALIAARLPGVTTWRCVIRFQNFSRLRPTCWRPPARSSRMPCTRRALRCPRQGIPPCRRHRTRRRLHLANSIQFN